MTIVGEYRHAVAFDEPQTLQRAREPCATRGELTETQSHLSVNDRRLAGCEVARVKQWIRECMHGRQSVRVARGGPERCGLRRNLWQYAPLIACGEAVRLSQLAVVRATRYRRRWDP